jgi:hypothetical protein
MCNATTRDAGFTLGERLTEDGRAKHRVRTRQSVSAGIGMSFNT